MGNEKLTTLARRLRPFLSAQLAALISGGAVSEGPDIDLVATAGGTQVGRGGDTILLFDSGGNPLAEYARSTAGLIAALAAATSGDTVQLPAGTINLTSGITVGTGVHLCGMNGKWATYLQSVGDIGSALVTLSGDGAQIDFLFVYYSTANSANPRYGIRQTGNGSKCEFVQSYCANAGAGTAVGHEIGPVSGECLCLYSGAQGYNLGGTAAGYSVLENGRLTSCRGEVKTATTGRGIQGYKGFVRQCEAYGTTNGMSFYSNSGGAETFTVIGGDAAGGTADLIVGANCTLNVYALKYSTSTITGALTYLGGDRAAYSVEDYHATDIEATALTRHNPLPGAAGGIPYSDGTNWTRVALTSYLGNRAVATITSGSTTLNTTHDIVLCNAASGAITAVLPAASSNTGRTYSIKKIDSSANTVTIDPNASETIDGATTVTIEYQYTNITIACDGTGWYIL